METGSAVIIFIFLIGICYVIYDSIPSKYTKLEESFCRFLNRSLVRFEYEKSLHTNMKNHYTLLFMVELLRGKHILLDNT